MLNCLFKGYNVQKKAPILINATFNSILTISCVNCVNYLCYLRLNNNLINCIPIVSCGLSVCRVGECDNPESCRVKPLLIHSFIHVSLSNYSSIPSCINSCKIYVFFNTKIMLIILIHGNLLNMVRILNPGC